MSCFFFFSSRRRHTRCSRDWSSDVCSSDLDAEPAERALGLRLHVAEALGVHVARMGIEAIEHAVDRTLDQLAVIGLLDVMRAHPLENVAEQVELAVGIRRPCSPCTRPDQ